jgi:hypothetical protein
MSAPDTFEFLVKGSAPEPYVVSFLRRDAKNISASCTCRAGESSMSCKHRIRILRGLVEGIVSDNATDVSSVEEHTIKIEMAAFRQPGLYLSAITLRAEEDLPSQR